MLDVQDIVIIDFQLLHVKSLTYCYQILIIITILDRPIEP